MTIFRKRYLLAIAGLLFAHAAVQAQERGLGAGGELLDGVAAVVNEGVVLKSELAEMLERTIQNLNRQQEQAPPEQRRPLPPAAVIEQQVLNQLIVREIQLQRANRVGITVSDDLLNEALSRVAQNLGYTLEELPAVLAAQDVDYTAYRDDSRKDLLIEQLEQRDVLRNIAITPRELEQCLADSTATASDAYDYNISHILIGVPANASQQDVEAARARINEIHQRLAAGEDFRQIAIANSQAQTALDGGSLGWRKGAQLPTLFADIVIRMKPGDFS
jgi:peptidyl-prolyl cis-trans isomerase SurA